LACFAEVALLLVLAAATGPWLQKRGIRVLEPLRGAADRAVKRLCGATEEQRTEFPERAVEGR
jgi:hypothetical protein